MNMNETMFAATRRPMFIRQKQSQRDVVHTTKINVAHYEEQSDPKIDYKNSLLLFSDEQTSLMESDKQM